MIRILEIILALYTLFITGGLLVLTLKKSVDTTVQQLIILLPIIYLSLITIFIK